MIVIGRKICKFVDRMPNSIQTSLREFEERMFEGWSIMGLFGRRISTCLVVGSFYGCVSNSADSEYLSGQPTIFATLDLFDQSHENVEGVKYPAWQGDWAFRRERLEIVDRGFRTLRPDVVFFQNVLSRMGSPSESDELILSAGALNRFNWKDFKIGFIEQSGENREMAIAASRPRDFTKNWPDNTKNQWQLGQDGYVTFSELDSVESPVLLVNVVMPKTQNQVNLWYSFLKDRILELSKVRHICPERVVVAGYLPYEGDSKRFDDMLNSLNLKDTAVGFCQNAEKCKTASEQNDIFKISSQKMSLGQMDRILVHKDTEVINAGMHFLESKENSRYKALYDLPKVWGSSRFGWFASVKLRHCQRLRH
ncbi:MAG: hypothetical protein NT027_02155 [Proteobacteria bacterium]|nr:hypothetical protein [Pseudomonadota bacterium]